MEGEPGEGEGDGGEVWRGEQQQRRQSLEAHGGDRGGQKQQARVQHVQPLQRMGQGRGHPKGGARLRRGEQHRLEDESLRHTGLQPVSYGVAACIT